MRKIKVEYDWSRVRERKELIFDPTFFASQICPFTGIREWLSYTSVIPYIFMVLNKSSARAPLL
jgi:hypothetical protein